MLLLSLDTSTTVCSVALHQNGALLGCYELFTERTSSAMLTTLAGEVVRHAGFRLDKLDGVVVAKGPGSYTGLRIGVSTAKGLCFALDKPMLSVNTLQAMTEQVRPYFPPATTPTLFCPMIDARRMEVYCTLYDEQGQEVSPTTAEVIDEQSFADWLTDYQLLFFGDGAEKCRPVLEKHPNAVFLDELIRPSARTVGKLATGKFRAGEFEDVATFEPFYLKEFRSTQPKKAVV
jgi:tRNA threonylcarbamoyladenosine biosynthesis protein TsaB